MEASRHFRIKPGPCAWAVFVLVNSNRKVRKAYGSGMRSKAEFYAEWMITNV